MTKRIFRSIFLVALAVFFASLALIMGMLYTYFSQVQRDQLHTQTLLAAQGAANEGGAYLQDLRNMQGMNCRITWIDGNGTVLYDSASDHGDMENHLEREEIREALDTGYGESERYSATLMARFLYSAQRLPDGTVLRLSMAQTTPLTLLLGIAQPICVGFTVALVLSMVLAARLSKRVMEPLNRLDLDAPLQGDFYEELKPLLSRIDSQQRVMRMQKAELHRKQNEFDTVTAAMSEGLLLLNSSCVILTLNPAAHRLLGIGRSSIGKNFLDLNQTLPIQELLLRALDGHPAEKDVVFGGSDYQVHAGPVFSEGVVTGVVLLMFDITEKRKAESLRREFTANVSHELKTPLQSISGYAELMQHGIVRPEDVESCAGKIYTEAQRMICLVQDIIRLSQLDEGSGEMHWEQVELYGAAKEAMASLHAQAELAQVKLTLEGSPTYIRGIGQLVSGVVFNLCDNAIKYNRPRGSVTVRVGEDEKGAYLSVTDTGIGIPAAYQSRVFERFFRVDKSRSKEVGGTGLGLSIVKHAVMILGGRVRLESTPGQGTAVTVRFSAET